MTHETCVCEGCSDRRVSDRHETFALDMDEHDIPVDHYHGRAFYRGPAARADNDEAFQEIIRATDVPLQWDSLGLGYIVYPR